MLKTNAIWFVCFSIVLLHCSAEDQDRYLSEDVTLASNNAYQNKAKQKPAAETDDDFDMEDALQNIESLAVIADQMIKINMISSADTESFYNYMIQAIDKLSHAIRRSDNIYKFMNANGPLRILSNNLMNPHSKLRTRLLMLLKDIFYLAPTTAESLLPLNIVDRLIDIFANDNNLALKAHALDILYKWMPKNPKIQVRIMKIASLETFYQQVDKLDIGVVQTLMQLFNDILKEHLNVRNDKTAIAKDDGETLIMYQRIGLLEHLSTPKVCNGLLNIFGMMWSYNRNESDNIKTVLELLQNVLPFCGKVYKNKPKAMEMFEQLSKFVKDESKSEYFEKLGVNVIDMADFLDNFLENKDDDDSKHDEF